MKFPFKATFKTPAGETMTDNDQIVITFEKTLVKYTVDEAT